MIVKSILPGINSFKWFLRPKVTRDIIHPFILHFRQRPGADFVSSKGLDGLEPGQSQQIKLKPKTTKMTRETQPFEDVIFQCHVSFFFWGGGGKKSLKISTSKP